MNDPRIWDAVVVGGSFAGTSSAMWLGRYRRTATVVDAGKPRNRAADMVHGYFGSDPISPLELLAQGRKQAEQYEGIRFIDDRATGLSRVNGEFVTELASGASLRSRRVILATGVRDEVPQVEGFAEHFGASLFHCPACDGYEARGASVAVLGWNRHVASFARQVREWARSVTIVTDGRSFEGDEAARKALEAEEIEILECRAVALEGVRGALEGILVDGGRRIECSFAFFSIAHHARSELAETLGCEINDEGCVVVDGNGETRIRGVYAAGDITPGPHLVQAATAEGAVAGVSCAKSLMDGV